MNLDLWQKIDFIKVEAEFFSDQRLKMIQEFNHNELINLCGQYRYFIHYFLNDFSVLISRLPESKLKDILEDIYQDEIGRGDPSQNHLALYDQFLVSIGAKIEECSPSTLILMEKLSHLTETSTLSYAIGLRGMAAECICGIYFKVMSQYLFSNPYIIKNMNKINKVFWDIHAGDDDEFHRKEVRSGINEFLMKQDSNSAQLYEGYVEGKKVWEEFWNLQFNKV